METKQQNPCRKQTKKAQQRELGGASQKCRQKALIGKASQRLTEKGIGKVTNLCTQEANHKKNYLSELKGQWGAAGQVATSLQEERRIAGWKAGRKQRHLRGVLGQGGLRRVCSNSESGLK